jgi:CHAD domain
MLAESGQMMTTNRTAIRRWLAISRKPRRPPWGRRQTSPWQVSGHDSIVARPLRATLAATVLVGVSVGVAALARAERERRAVRARLREHERHYGLLADETAAHGLQRIALGQLDLALELLHGEADVSAEEAVHETRKGLKRARALLRLLEGELGSGRTARERTVLRDAARRLAGARDAEVMVGTLDALARRHPRKLGRRRGLVELQARLHRERDTAVAQTLGDAAARAQVGHELEALRARVARWELPDRAAGKLVGPGLERIYRAGRTHRARARRSSPRRKPDRTLHEWRKHVKDLRYAAEVLDVREPPGSDEPPPSPRSRGRNAKLARRADGLGELLGEEHDLALLAQRVRKHKPLRRRKRTRKLLLRTIARRRADLRKRALRTGKQLYEHKPRRFARRVLADYARVRTDRA